MFCRACTWSCVALSRCPATYPLPPNSARSSTSARLAWLEGVHDWLLRRLDLDESHDVVQSPGKDDLEPQLPTEVHTAHTTERKRLIALVKIQQPVIIFPFKPQTITHMLSQISDSRTPATTLPLRRGHRGYATSKRWGRACGGSLATTQCLRSPIAPRRLANPFAKSSRSSSIFLLLIVRPSWSIVRATAAMSRDRVARSRACDCLTLLSSL